MTWLHLSLSRPGLRVRLLHPQRRGGWGARESVSRTTWALVPHTVKFSSSVHSTSGRWSLPGDTERSEWATAACPAPPKCLRLHCLPPPHLSRLPHIRLPGGHPVPYPWGGGGGGKEGGLSCCQCGWPRRSICNHVETSFIYCDVFSFFLLT